MADILQTSPAGQPIAIVGLACRFPDADDPPALHDMVLTGRRAFRRIPPCRADLTGYPSTGPAVRDATQSPRAALIEGWQFNTDRFRIPMTAYTAADPAQWLALETAAQALAGAGFPGAEGLARDRVGVFIGNALGTGSSHPSALRMRWPHVRRVLAGALSAANIPAEAAGQVLRHAADQYLAPLPQTSDDTLASIIPESIIPASIVSVICGYFGFRGGSLAVDGGCASSLPAVTSACLSIISGDIDVALAGGVDLSLDPLGLAGLAGTGPLATADVRVYDENPTGFLPGEGCGMVVLMRTAQARAARLRIYAEIAGWGTSAAGQGSGIAADAAGQLVALRRACEGAGTDPADIQLIEGHGAGTAAGDEAELTALAELHKGARGGAHTGTREAALGSITANMGHAGAAAGVAGLIKTALALSAGVIPPATGWSTPHPVLRGSGGALRLPRSAEQWPAGARTAGVSAMGLGGLNLHLILRGPSATQSRLGRVLRVLPQRASPGSRPGTGPAVTTSRASDGTARAELHAAFGANRAARQSGQTLDRPASLPDHRLLRRK